ncbi:futalosine hydrolase [Streptomyces meridianus]|uniref:Futalosine hydrolase n=1 Tax=Streptomyces meridianus TaxID=2938945 RepID=A0ABT0X2U1_9ACTN|nr:futalosine hydrolase [Streptomyces meridianus]MCM2576861.1 futalosine hydrolase [Streptomyces meridianus]
MRILVVTAVAAERDAAARGLPPSDGEPAPSVPGCELLRRALPAPQAAGGTGGSPGTVDLLAAGVGPAAAAAGTAAALTATAVAGRPYDLVVSAGIGGGFTGPAPVGSVVVADAIVAADLGAELPGRPDGFLPVSDLGFGTSEHLPPAALSAAVARAVEGVHAPVLTVSTVTGSAERAADLASRHPGAAAEAMEGFGVAEAAALQGLPVLEIRGVSNPVGPRDRAGWDMAAALTAVERACGATGAVLGAWKGPLS